MAELRTQQEILARILDPETDDFLGTERGDLINFLTFENAKQYLKEDTSAAEWDTHRSVAIREEIIARMKDYFEFAWGKADGERGLSASRSISHYSAWVWLLNDGKYEEFRTLAETGYEPYGKPVLRWLNKTYELGGTTD